MGDLTSAGQHLVPQEHERYTREEHAVWRAAVRRTEAVLAELGHRVHPAFHLGFREMRLPVSAVPRIEDINRSLAPTGWSTVCVAGYIPARTYVSLMARRVFPVSRVLRSMDQLDFAAAPDMVHDVCGHLPMLFCREHRNYLQDLARTMAEAMASPLEDELYEANREMALRRCDPSSPAEAVAAAEARVRRLHAELAADPSEATHLRRLYLWTIEFGLMGTIDRHVVYGAALMSAPREIRAVYDGGTIAPYGLGAIRHDIEFSDLQRQYFVAGGYDELRSSLRIYDRGMCYRRRGRSAWNGSSNPR